VTTEKRRRSTVKTSPTAPKHKLIADQLLADIEDGRWTPGSQIPSEDQLVTEMDASLGTIRRALSNLVEMGVLERYHGKGTFVSGARAPERHLRHFRFVAEGSSTLLPVFFKIVNIEETTDHGPWQIALEVKTNRFVRIARIATINNEFDVFSELYLPADRFALSELTAGSLDGVSIRDLLAERFNAPTLKTRQLMRCEPTPPRVARRIGVPAGQYGMVWTICGLSYRETPITWQRIFIPPSDRALELSSFPQLDLVGGSPPA
jgi:GntR family transcriptional regulator